MINGAEVRITPFLISCGNMTSNWNCRMTRNSRGHCGCSQELGKRQRNTSAVYASYSGRIKVVDIVKRLNFAHGVALYLGESSCAIIHFSDGRSD